MIFVNIMIITIGILTILLLVTFAGSIWVTTPYVPTPTPVAERMVALAQLNGNETVYDLGAGDGAILIAAKRMHPGIVAKGWEFVLVIWLIGLVRIRLSKQDVSLRLGDAFRVPLQNADRIFLYLLPSKMKKLGKKFDRELRPGTVVISHAFQFPGRTPIAHDELTLHGKRKTMWVYRW